MRPREQPQTGQADMFRARLDQIINLDHKLVRLGRLIDWRFIESRCGGRIPTRPGTVCLSRELRSARWRSVPARRQPQPLDFQ